MKLIDKDKVVKELERRVKAIRKAFNEPGILSGVDRTYATAQYDAFKSLLTFLDTLEVKEVDLDSEVEDWVKTGPHTSYPWCTIPDAIRITAKHFFNFGLKCTEIGKENKL